MGTDQEPKPIVKKVKVHGNPLKRFQATSEIVVKIRPDDALETPPTLPDGTPLSTEKQPGAQRPSDPTKWKSDIEMPGNPK